ncbi:MAG TPA: lysylphosphatidylglycerol synthase transmembrane domain-containing protein [Methanolinea sp.]|jgi:uncharacterized membrane protein YbhN (UPF0104 family)|nr:lysylphosphatidylglycerol synthase transmembrane domain-containing protein [Methanolinea sp.]
MNLRRLIYFTLAAVGIIILIIFIYRSGLYQNPGILLSINIPVLLLAFLFTQMTIFLKIKRWQYLCVQYNFPISLRESTEVVIASFFPAGVSPGRIGDFMKADFMKIKYSVPFRDGISMVFYERIFELIIIFLVAVGILFIGFSAKYYIILEFTLFLLIFLGVMYLFSDRFIHFFQNIARKKFRIFNSDEIKIRKISPRIAFNVSLYTILALGCEFIRLWLVAYSFGYSLQIIHLSIFFSLAVLIGLLSQIPIGIGITEGSLSFFLMEMGVPYEIAVGIAVIDRAISMYFVILIGFFYYHRMRTYYVNEGESVNNHSRIQ